MLYGWINWPAANFCARASILIIFITCIMYIFICTLHICICGVVCGLASAFEAQSITDVDVVFIQLFFIFIFHNTILGYNKSIFLLSIAERKRYLLWSVINYLHASASRENTATCQHFFFCVAQPS